MILSATTSEILTLIGIPVLAGLLMTLIWNVTTGKFKKAKSDGELNRKALQAILRDKLRQHYINYIELGEIDHDDKRNFDNLYQIYHLMGKNGVMTTMYEEIMELPLTKRSKNKLDKG